MRWLSVLPLLFLAGCATSRPAVTVSGPDIPESSLTCRDAPEPDYRTQREAAAFMIDLAEAGSDCRQKLGSVRSILKGTGQ